MELTQQEGVTITEKGACSACRGTIRSVFYDLERMGKLKHLRDLFIVVGPQAELPKDMERTPLIMGTCLKRYEGESCYVIGCPPNNDQIIGAIKQLCSL